MAGTFQSLAAWCDSQVGVAETPAHSNIVYLLGVGSIWRNFWGLSYEPGWPWCACFASAADWYNGTPLPAIDGPRGYISVDSGRAWFRSHGLLVPNPKQGYLAFYNEHTGRVKSVNSDGSFWAWEGNDGDAVRVVLRSRSEVVGGFGVREYASTPSPTAEEDEPVLLQPKDPCQTIDATGKRLLLLNSDQGGTVRVAVGVGAPNVGSGHWVWGPQNVFVKGPDPAAVDLGSVTKPNPGEFVTVSLTITDDTKNAVGVTLR